MMARYPERRQFTRIKFNTEVSLTQGESVFHSHVLDISLNGLLVSTPESYDLQTTTPLTAKITLANEAEIKMKITLAHSGSEVLGFHCESIDVDSVGHLRRLIELNMDDPKASDRVLRELLESH